MVLVISILDIIVNKLKNKYKTEVTLSDPKVMYRETITKNSCWRRTS